MLTCEPIRFRGFAALGAMIATAITGSCAARPDAIEPVKVGVLNPITGALASLGPPWENAARLAAEQVNAAGGLFDGRPLEIVFKDSGTARAQALEAAKELVDEGVVAFVGPATSGESAVVLEEVAKPNEIPMVSCCATAVELTQGNAANSGFFFRTTPSDELQGKALAYLAANGFSGDIQIPACPAPRAAFVHRNDSYGAGFLTVFQDEFLDGGDFFVDPVSYGSPDAEASQADLDAAATSMVDKIEASLDPAADNGEVCIVVIAFDVDGGSVIRKMDDELIGLVQTKTAANPAFRLSYHFLVGDGANSREFARIVGATGARVFGTVPYHSPKDDNAYVEFSKAYRKRFNDEAEPVAFTSQNYDAVFLVSLAITEARSTVGKDIRNKLFSVSREGELQKGRFFGEIAAAMLAGTNVDYAGPSGEVDFDAFGDVESGDYILWQVEADPEDTNAFRVVERDPLPASQFNEPR